MLFKFQWHFDKHSLELDLGPGLIYLSPESNVNKIHHVRQLLNMAKSMFKHFQKAHRQLQETASKTQAGEFY